MNYSNVEAFVVATLMFTNGICPLCRRKVANNDNTIDISLVRKHMEEMDEHRIWERIMRRYMGGEER